MVPIKNEVTLFAIPFAGGNKYSFNSLKGLFPRNINFFPVELPGRGMRINEGLKFNIEELVEDLYQQIHEQLNKPYAFYGHSMGAILAYLLTKKIITEKSNVPIHLFLSGRAGPSSKDERRRYLLPKAEFIKVLIELGGMSEDIFENEALMDFFEPVLRADFQAVETYEYQVSASMNIPITVLMGNEDRPTIEEIGSWQKETAIPINLYQFTGGHFFIFDHSESIAEIVAGTLRSGVS